MEEDDWEKESKVNGQIYHLYIDGKNIRITRVFNDGKEMLEYAGLCAQKIMTSYGFKKKAKKQRLKETGDDSEEDETEKLEEILRADKEID